MSERDLPTVDCDFLVIGGGAAAYFLFFSAPPASDGTHMAEAAVYVEAICIVAPDHHERIHF